MDYIRDFMESKYHLSVAERMLNNYKEYPSKRFLIGVINEGAKSASKLIRSFLIREKTKGNMKTFLERVAPKYLDGVTIENMRKILEIERAQKLSPIEFAKGDKIILLINEKYRILTALRLREFIKSVKCAILEFSASIKR